MAIIVISGDGLEKLPKECYSKSCRFFYVHFKDFRHLYYNAGADTINQVRQFFAGQ